MVTKKQLVEMSEQNIETIDRNELADIAAVPIERDLPQNEKLLSFFEKIKNPYCFLCEGIPVKVCYRDDGPGFSQMLQDFFIRIKEG